MHRMVSPSGVLTEVNFFTGLLKKRKKARMDPPPAPSSSATTSHRVTEEKQIKVETIATGTQEVSVA